MSAERQPVDGPLESGANSVIVILGVAYLAFATCVLSACAPADLPAPELSEAVQLERLSVAATIAWAGAVAITALAPWMCLAAICSKGSK